VNLPASFTLLQVTPELETGGAEQTTLDVAHAVIDAGGQCLVAARGGRMTARLQADGGRLAQMPVQSKNPLVMLGNAARLSDLIKREGVSLVHARSRAPAFSALWAAHSNNVPFVATYHGVYNAKTALKRWYNAVMTRGDMVIANSQFTREHVIAEHGIDPDKVVAIPRGIDLKRFNPGLITPARLATLRTAWGVAPDERRPLILLAGRLTRWKGQGLLIEAAAKLKAMGQDRFIIVMAGDEQGRAGYHAELDAAIAAAGLTEQVRIVGHCDDMPAAYALADFAVAPSLEPEAFGRTAVEPQIMGRAVIAADHGAARETVVHGQTGWLAAPGDADAWAAALSVALEAGVGRRASMGELGRNRARKLYSVEAMCEATLEVYAHVLETRARAAPSEGFGA
jgi:glycosyltransferase involved in cell wall biosynthesis